MLTRHDLGHRVVVRCLAGHGGVRPIFSDVLGELTELTETSITLRTRRGPVTVARNSIVTGKRIPDRRRLTGTEALERAAAGGWPAPDTALLGDWLLRSAQGWTNRGNSALAIGEPDRPIAAAVDAVVGWYADRGRPPMITVPEPVGGRVIRELTDRGWTPSPVTLVRTTTLDALLTVARRHPDIRLDKAPPPTWLEVVAGRKQGLPDAARHILTAVPETRFAGLYDPAGRALAIGRGVVAADREWLGLSLVEVDPGVRRTGLGSAIVGALAEWAARIGARRAYLQVEERNAAAVALYGRLGFDTHHRYATWRAQATAAPPDAAGP
ncbi:MAG TPA: GNAT family N-acetyltransferase [Micromonosporaceae bacterium]|nr:GNAT family N-acetyltransferase [Micromonosporaceae bacterium]